MKRHGGTFGINGKMANKNTWAALALLAAVGYPMAARAQSMYTWDSSGSHPTAPVDGSGNWDTSTANWSTGYADVIWPNDNSIPVFGNGGMAGTVTLQQAINAGAVLFNSVSSGAYTIANGGVGDTLTLNATAAIGLNANANISAPIAGSVGLTVMGTGTLNLSGANTYTGATLINGGTLQLGAANTLPAATALTVNGGATFDTDNQAQTIASLAGAGTVNLESGSNLTLNQSTSTTFSGTISGSGTLTKLLAGTLTFTAPETGFTGTLALTNTVGNTVVLSGNANINNSSIVATMNVIPNGGGVAVNLSNLTTTLSAPISFNTANTNATNEGTGDFRFSVNALAGANTISSPITVTFPNTAVTSHPSVVFTSNAGTLSVGSNVTVNSDAAQGQIVFRGALTESYTGEITAPSTVQVATTDGGTCYFSPAANSTWGTTNLGGPAAAGPGYGLDITSDSALNGSTSVANGSNSLLFGGGHLELNNYTSNLNFVQANMGNTTTDALVIGAAAVDVHGNPVSAATYAGSITLTGTNPVDFMGPGTLILAGSMSYSGATGINSGIIQMGNSFILPISNGSGASAFTIAAGATLDLQDTYQQVKSLAGAGNLALTGPDSVLEIDGGSTTFSGVISGTGELDVLAGTAKLTLSGNNTGYTGETYINGTLTVGSATAMSSGSDVVDFGTLAIGAQSPTLGSLSGAGTVTGTGNLTVGADNNSKTFGGVINITGSLTMVGSGTWTLDGNNIYAGATNINSGTLQLGTNNALPVPAAPAVPTTLNIASGGTFDMNGNNQQIGALTGSGAILLSGQLTVGGASTNSSFSGAISGGGTLTVAEGADTLTVTGSNSSFTGSTQINSGTLAINNDSAINLGQVSFNGGTLQFMNYASSASFNNVSNLTLGAATGAASTLNGAITGSNGLTFAGPGMLLLTNTGNNYTGGTTIAGGTLQFATGTYPGGMITVNSPGVLNIAGPFTTVMGTLPDINPSSTGVLALMGNSSENVNFSGYSNLGLGASANSVYTGTLTPGGNTYYLGSGSGATLTLPNTNAITGANNLVIGWAGATGTVVLPSTNNFTGTITLNGDTLEIGSDAAINSGSITFAGGGLQLDGYSSSLPAFSNSGGAPVIIAVPAGAPSTLNSTMPSGAGFTYQGPGTLLLGTNMSLSATAPLVVNGGTLDLNGHSQTVGTLAAAGDLMIESGAMLTASSVGSTTISGIISGGGAFTRNAAGVLTVTGANTISGPVSITQTGTTVPTTLALSGNGSFNNASLLTLTNTVSTGGTNDVTVTLSNLAAPLSVPIDIVTPTTGGDFRIAMNNNAGNNTVTSPTTMNAGENKTNVSTLTYSSAANTVMTISSAVTIPGTNGSNAITASPVGTNAPTITINGQLGFRGIGTTSTQIVGIFNGSIGGSGASNLLIAKTDPDVWVWDPSGYPTGPSTTIPSIWGALNIGVGTIQMGEANALCPTAIFEMTSGSAIANTAVFDLNGFNQTITGLASTTTGGATVTSTNGPATLTLNAPSSGTYIFGGGVTDSITGPLTINIAAGGTGVQEFNEPNTYTGGTNLNGGTLSIAALSDLGSGPITFNGGTLAYLASNTIDITTNNNVSVASGGGTINVVANSPTYANSITGTGTLSKTGTGTLTFNSPLTLGGLTISGGPAHLAAASNTFSGTITTSGSTSALQIDGATTAGTVAINVSSTLTADGVLTAGKLQGDGTGTLKITAGKVAATAQGQSTLNLAALSVLPGAVLDIGNGNIAVNYGAGADPLSSIVAYIKDGYNQGNWNGSSLVNGSIISSAAIGKATALGYADNTTLHQVQVKYTWYGDLNLDGVVNDLDLAAMGSSSVISWSTGDLNYDGVVNADDYALFMYGNASQNGSISAGVPEPASATLLMLPLAAGLGLRKRRR